MATSERRDRKQHKRWFLEMSSGSGSSSLVKFQELPAPHSYVKHGGGEVSERDQKVDKDLVVKRSWDIAIAPLKQVPMNAFMMWMAGSSISMFPIMMVGMMAFRPIQAFLSLSQTFKMIEGEQAPLQKLAYIGGNLVAMAMAVYKCNTMGLLPTHASDWLAFADPPQLSTNYEAQMRRVNNSKVESISRMEYVAGGFSLQ